MSGFNVNVKWVAIGLAAVLVAGAAGTAEAQSARRTRRESNANRKARIARTIAETYTHRYEIGGGGGFLRFRSGEYLQKNSEVTFWMSGTYNLSEKVGIVADVRGAYGNAKVGNTPFNIPNPQISQYTFLAGPQYRFYRREKTSASAFVVGGVGLGKFDDGSKGLLSENIHVWQSATRPVVSAGVNLDYNFYPNLAFRVTPTYVGTLYRLAPNDTTPGSKGSIQNNLGVNLGFLYRFGRIK